MGRRIGTLRGISILVGGTLLVPALGYATELDQDIADRYNRWFFGGGCLMSGDPFYEAAREQALALTSRAAYVTLGLTGLFGAAAYTFLRTNSETEREELEGEEHE